LFLDELVEIVDTLTMYPEERRKVVRLLAEIEADVELTQTGLGELRFGEVDCLDSAEVALKGPEVKLRHEIAQMDPT
jgi:hypothetical protein